MDHGRAIPSVRDDRLRCAVAGRGREPHPCPRSENQGGYPMKVLEVVTRRDFLRGTAGLLIASAFAQAPGFEVCAQERSRVVIIRNPKALSEGGEADTAVLRSMLDEALPTLLGEKDPQKTWQRLFTKSDVVGIKSNV